MSRSWLCLALFCVAFDRAAAQGLAAAQAGAGSQSPAPTPPGLITARSLCDQGHHDEAIDLFDRLLGGRLGTDAAAEVELALDRCMTLVERADDSQALLLAIRRRQGGPGSLKALSALARREVVQEEGCHPGGPLYRELVDRHGATREAARVILVRAIHCLKVKAHEAEALRDLETVAALQAGQPEGAMALYDLGHHYRQREERSRAAVYYQKLVDSYPETIEYPRRPGLEIVKSARTDLDLLHLYYFSPRLDRLKSWIEREVLVGHLHLDSWDAGPLAVVLVPWLVHVGALGFVLLLVPVLRRRGRASWPPDGSLFDRTWTVWQASLLLVGCWTAALLLQLIATRSFFRVRLQAIWRFLAFQGGGELIFAAIVLFLVLRREPLSRVFAIDRRRLVRLVLWSVGGIVGTAVVAGLVLAGLVGTGIVGPRDDLDRFLSTEMDWPSEWWSLGLVLVVVSAVVEEVLFRGVLHDALRRTVGVPAAAVLGSFVFAMIHVRPLLDTVVVFIIGLALVLVRERFRSLAPGSIFHSLWNLLAFWLKQA